MAVRTNFSRKNSTTTTIEAELAIDVDTIEYKTSIFGRQSFRNSFVLPFNISVDGSNYYGKIVLQRDGMFACYVYGVKSLTGNVSMTISNGNSIFSDLGPRKNGQPKIPDIPDAKNICISLDNVNCLKGILTITFQPNI